MPKVPPFRIRTDGSEFQVVKSVPSSTDGHNLFHGLSIDGDTIIGVTRNGGDYGYGTLFGVKISGVDFTVLHHFGNGRDGRHPYNGPVLLDTTLYGMTFLGGGSAAGALYGYEVTTGTYGVRHSFLLPGGKPFGSLTVVGEWLYGTVNDHRSTTDHGLIFRYRPADDAYQIVHVFVGFRGAAHLRLDGPRKYAHAIAARDRQLPLWNDGFWRDGHGSRERNGLAVCPGARIAPALRRPDEFVTTSAVRNGVTTVRSRLEASPCSRVSIRRRFRSGLAAAGQPTGSGC